jgi:hypothetical protein
MQHPQPHHFPRIVVSLGRDYGASWRQFCRQPQSEHKKALEPEAPEATTENQGKKEA